MKKIIVFGASTAAKNFIQQQTEYEIIVLTDNNPEKHDTKWCGYDVVPVTAIPNYEFDGIAIATSFFHPIQKQLLEQFGIKEEQIIKIPKLILKGETPFEDEQTLQLARSMIQQLAKLFIEKNVKCILSFGSLLGLIRDGDLIPWDDDIDFSIDAADFDAVFHILQTSLTSLPHYDQLQWNLHVVKNAHGVPTIIKMHFTQNAQLPMRDFAIDFWPIYYKDGMAATEMSCVPEEHYLTTSELNFWGQTVQVPHDPETYLARIYGDWKKPRKDFSFGDLLSAGHELTNLKF